MLIRLEVPITRLAWFIGAGFGSGLFPVAPATAGSLVALAIYWWLPLTGNSPGLFILIGVGLLLGIWATGRMSIEANPDPKQAVWDEFIGMWATCILVPKTLPGMAGAFICFRILDIWKPWPIRRLERLHGGVGIMSDDLLAGVFGAAMLYGIRLLSTAI
ncbi:MAG: phosphatidylglycerophosphatase A [Chloroflexota bacterium]|nr:phosphatidylglycerophosphatase A [Chloroflexota bacterium]